MFALTAGAVVVFFGGVTVFPFFTTTAVEFKEIEIAVYGDRSERENSGNSEIPSINRKSTDVTFSHILRKGYACPYAGIHVNLKNGDVKIPGLILYYGIT